MSKASVFAKTLKLIVTLTARGLRLAVTLAAKALKELQKGINKRLRFSITFKTATIYALIFSAVLFVLSIIMVTAFGAFLLYEDRNTLKKGALVAENYLTETDGIPEAGLKKYAEIEGMIITLFDKHRDIIYTTAGKQDQAAIANETNTAPGISVTARYIHLFMDRKSNNDNVYYMQLSRALWEGKFFLVILICAVLAGFVPAVLFTVVIGSRTLRKMLKPINNMIGTAKAISAADLNTRLSVVDSHDELKDLAETFNDMLDRIQASYEQQNRFVSDASHELRTPIAVIQGYASLLQRWGKEDKAVLDESVGAIKNEAENMKDLVERLLFLARADKNTQKIEKTFFSLNELISEVLKETKLIDNEHTINGEVTGIISVNGDRKLIKQALRVFLDNSIRYTPAGGTIKIEGRVKGNTVVVVIEDNGIGISSEDLPHIFDRFYKCDKSRTREGGSTGLGLSIARWIVGKHEGKITVESVLNKGTKFIITLPVQINNESKHKERHNQ